MEPSYLRYIWMHTRRQQIWLLCAVALSMVPYYLAFDLPRLIVNGPILGEGFAGDVAQPFAPGRLDLPGAGRVDLLPVWQIDRSRMLMALSLAFLGMVVVNGLFKFYINTFKGQLGERLLRRLRYELVDRILRARPVFFRQMKGGEVASMVKDEVEPLGGFTGDAFVQPALLGGQAVTALGFILVQNLRLGMVAGLMAGVQIVIIPRMRRRLVRLGRARQLTARELAGRITEIADGIATIHANGTSNWERADISARLGRIFRIRYEIYRWKFMVKFLNNFLAQVTPFLFYLVGGWLAIRGQLDVGQLVAVINAYKELPGPLTELIDWDLARQDVEVKYEQVAEQLGRIEPLDPALQRLDPRPAAGEGAPAGDAGGLAAVGVTVSGEGGARLLDHVSLRLARGERLALTGDAASGAETLAEVFGHIVWPDSGRVLLDGADLFALPESLAGRRITYAGQDAWFLHGTLRDNLTYGLRHAPAAGPGAGGAEGRARRWASREARRSGNPDLDPGGDRIVPGAANLGPDGQVAIASVLDVVQLSDLVFDLGLHATPDPDEVADFAGPVVALRRAFRAEIERPDLARLVVPFVEGDYNPEASVIENLLFGVFAEGRDRPVSPRARDTFHRFLADTGLDRLLAEMGLGVARNVVELLADLPTGHPLFERLETITAADIPQLAAVVKRAAASGIDRLPPDSRRRLIDLALRYVEPQHRFGVLTPAIRARIVAARALLMARTARLPVPILQHFRQDAWLPSAPLIDNIVFGKINLRSEGAEAAVRTVIRRLLDRDPALRARILGIGLRHDLGAEGRRLTPGQRQRLGLARALLRRSDYYVFNRPLAGLESGLQSAIARDAVAFLAAQGHAPGILWVLSNPALAGHFDRRAVFRGGVIAEEDSGQTAATYGARVGAAGNR